MAVELNHTIVHARDPLASATMLAQILGLAPPLRFGPFEGVTLANGVTLDFTRASATLTVEHYAFLVSEAEFDAILARLAEARERERARG